MKIDKQVLVLLAISLIFFLPFFIKPEILIEKDNDLGRNYVPLFSFLKDTFNNYHQIPLWRPSQMMGESFVGNPLSSLTYPLNLIFIFSPVNFAAILYQYIHFGISSLSVYMLARTFKFSRTSSFSSAIFYTFSIKILFHITAGHITMLAAYSFFPLVFYSLRQTIHKKGFKYLVLGSISLSFMYITYPTIFFYTVLFVAAYSIYSLIDLKFRNINSNLSESGSIILKALMLILFALFLSSAALIPNLEFGPLTTRSILKIEDVAIPIWNIKKFLMSLFFPYSILKELDQESVLFAGFVPTFLAFIGFILLKNIKKLVLVAFLIVTILYIAGTSTPFFKLAYDFLPFLNYSRVTTRPYFIVILIISLLSAFAIEKIKNKKFIYLLVFVFLVESVFIFASKLQSIPYLNFGSREIYEFLAKDKSVFRIYCTTYCFNPQLLNQYKIQTFAGETPIQYLNFINFLQKAGNYEYNNFVVIFPPYQVWQTSAPPQPDPLLLGEANVKYVASTYELSSPHFSLVKKFGGVILYQNKKFKEKVYFKNMEEIKEEYHSPNSIYVNFAPKHYDRELIFSENYYPGWKAFVDKNEKTIEKENGIFRKVTVPANRQEVLLRYQPESFAIGRALSFGTLIFMLLLLFRKNGKKD